MGGIFLIFLTKENKIAIAACIEKALMRRGDDNFNLVLSKLKNIYNCEISECTDNLGYLRMVLKEVYQQGYNSVLEDITWELEILDMDDFKVEFCKTMAS